MYNIGGVDTHEIISNWWKGTRAIWRKERCESFGVEYILAAQNE